LPWDAAQVLVLEDESVVGEVLVRILGRLAERIDVAPTMAAARALLAAGRRYHLLLVDKNLPDGSGIDFVREALLVDPGSLAIVVTAYPSSDSLAAAIGAGAWGYLTKPFRRIDTVTEEIRAANERRARGEPPVMPA
jgi:DNA-binding NtrC family response regulator